MAKDKKKKEVTEEVTEEIVDKVCAEELEETKEPTLEEQIETLNNTIKELKNNMLKQHADLENTKKRLEKERVTERKYAAMNVCKQIITPLDHFDLALKHEGSTEEVQNFLQGFKMIKEQLSKALEEQGVSSIDALDEEYNPNFHQAIMTEKVEGKEANIVLEVLQKGYMYKDRLIRPAIVKISE